MQQKVKNTMSTEDTELDMNTGVMVGDDKVTLAELAGVSLDEIVEQRGGGLPAGVYVLEIPVDELPHWAVVESKDIKKGVAKFVFTVLECIELKYPAEVPEGVASLIGRKHTETFFMSPPIEKSLGYMKAFMTDIGCIGSGSATQRFAACGGLRIMGIIQHRKDPNDADKVYINIVRSKMKKMARAVGSDVAAQIAA